METSSKSVIGESGAAPDEDESPVVPTVVVAAAGFAALVSVLVVAAVVVVALTGVGLNPPFSSFSHSIVNSAVKCLNFHL